jgi:uncharacterized protein
MTRAGLVAALLLAAVVGSLSCGGNSGAQQTGLEIAVVTVEGSGGGASHPLTVEIARTGQQRQVGLMFREELGAESGMLFLFPTLSASGFWMRNTLIPLDIAYLAADGTIQEIREGEPLNETPLRPAEPYLYVVETNRGWFEGKGLGVGDRVVIPQEVLDGTVVANRIVVPALARNAGNGTPLTLASH